MNYEKYATNILKYENYKHDFNWPDLTDEIYDNSLKEKRYFVYILENRTYYEEAYGETHSNNISYLDVWYVSDKSKLSDFLIELNKDKKKFIVTYATKALETRFKVDVSLA